MIRRFIAISMLAAVMAPSIATRAGAASQQELRSQVATSGATIAALAYQPRPTRRGDATPLRLPDVQIGEATAVCGQAILQALGSEALERSLERLGIEGEIVSIAEAGADTVELLVRLPNGADASIIFDAARIITEIAGLIPGGRLFGAIGTPALYCVQAALVVDQQLGQRLGAQLREAALAEARHAAED